MTELMNASDQKTQHPKSSVWKRAAAIVVSLLMLATVVIVPVTQGADDDLELYPLAASNFGRVLRVSGVAEPGQVVRIEANEVMVARTIANESGDFAVAFIPQRGENIVQAVEDGALYPARSDRYRVRHDPPLAFDRTTARPATKAAGGRAFTTKALAVPTLEAPPATTTANPITLSGTAPVDSEINVYVNGRYTRKVPVTAGGTFSMWVPLEDGLNSVYVIATTTTESSPASNTVQTTYTNSIARTYGTTTISAPTVWTAGNAPTYTLNGTITINSTGALWIQPGVTVNVSGNYKIIASGGDFMVRGTSASRVLLRPSTAACTDATPRRSDWDGIETTRVASPAKVGTVSTEYADVYCATNGVNFNGGTGSLRYSRFINNTTGARTKGTSSSILILPLISGDNEFRGATNGIYVDSDSRPTISGNNLLTENTNGITVDGVNIAASASNPLPVINGNRLYANSSRNMYTLNFGTNTTIVLDAIGNWWGTADPALISTTIRDRKDSTSAPYVNFTGFLNAAGGTSAYTGTTLYQPIATTATLPAGDYLLLGDIQVNANIVLTLSPGVNIRSVPGGRIRVLGTLQASGSSTQRVRFTSAKPYPAMNDWDGIEVLLNGTAHLNYARIEYATNGVDYNAGQGSITRSLIRFCERAIIVRAKSNPTINLGNEISNNDYGIYVDGNGTAADNPLPVANGNSLFLNSSHNYYATGFGGTAKPTLNATGNWWGTAVASGVVATIYNGDSTSPPVDSSGFLAAEPALPAVRLSVFSMTNQGAKPLVSTQPAAGVFTINRAATVNFAVLRDVDGAVVRQWSQAPAAAGQFGFTWDGRDDATNIVAPGVYRVTLTASDGLDDHIYDAPVPPPLNGNTDGIGTAPRTFNPYTGQLYKLNVTFQKPTLARLRVTPQVGSEFYVFTNVFYPADVPHWIYWDGRGPDGQLMTTSAMVWLDDGTIMRPNGIYVFGPTIAITGTAAVPNIEVRSDPYLIASSYEQVARITYRVSQDATVRMTLLPPGISDPSHASAIVLVNNVLQPAKDGGGAPIDYTVEWKGFNAADPNAMLVSSDGAYTYAIEATIPGTSYNSLYRGVLNVVQ